MSGLNRVLPGFLGWWGSEHGRPSAGGLREVYDKDILVLRSQLGVGAADGAVVSFNIVTDARGVKARERGIQ